MGNNTKAVLGSAKTTAKHVSIEGTDVVLNLGNHPLGIRIPMDMYSVWVFDKDESPLIMYQGELQWPCFIQFKGDKKPDGTRGAFMQGGGEKEEGNNWFGMFSLFSKINSELLFRQLCKGKHSDEQIQLWIDNPQLEESGLPV